MTVGAVRKVVRIKSVRGNLYDNCLAASAVSTNSFYRAREMFLSAVPFPTFPTFTAYTFALVYNMRNIFSSYSFSSFSSDGVSFQEKCVSHWNFLCAFNISFISNSLFDRDPHTTISSFPFVKSPMLFQNSNRRFLHVRRLWLAEIRTPEQKSHLFNFSILKSFFF